MDIFELKSLRCLGESNSGRPNEKRSSDYCANITLLDFNIFTNNWL